MTEANWNELIRNLPTILAALATFLGAAAAMYVKLLSEIKQIKATTIETRQNVEQNTVLTVEGKIKAEEAVTAARSAVTATDTSMKRIETLVNGHTQVLTQQNDDHLRVITELQEKVATLQQDAIVKDMEEK